MRSFYDFLNEVSKKDIKKINLKRDLHFNNIFGNKLRIVIPLDQNEKLNKLIEKLRDLGYDVDYEDLINKKQVYKKIKTQQGEKIRPEKVGKALQSNIVSAIKSNQSVPEKYSTKEKFSNPIDPSYIKSSKSELSELLDWWQKNGENLKNNEVGASIVISRSPIDVLRMSDHDGISSCHSPSGAFYKCARQEARTGGAVAYVVKNSDLKKVNLQDKEIFEDRSRKISGIIPLERLRLRRLTNGDIDLLLPETRTYGIKNVGFFDAVKNWAKESQKNLIGKINPEDDYDSFELKGGSYQDTNADMVWSKFFDVNVSGKKTSADQDEEDEDEGIGVYDRAQKTLENHRKDWQHVDVYLDEQENYLHFSAYLAISIPKKLFSVNLVKLLNEKEWREKIDIERELERSLDISGIQDFQVEDDGNSIGFRIMFVEEDGYGDQLTNFEHFLDYVDEVDKNFDQHVSDLKKQLFEMGYLRDVTAGISFNNLWSKIDADTIQIKTKHPEKIGYLENFKISRNQISGVSKVILGGGFSKSWEQEFVNYINEYKVLPIKLDYSDLDFYLSPTAKGLSFAPRDDWGQNIENEKENYVELTGWMNIELDYSINAHDPETVKRIKDLDKNWQFYLIKLSKLFEIFIANKKSTTPLLGVKVDKKQLAQKPFSKKPTEKQLNLSFKNWLKRN